MKKPLAVPVETTTRQTMVWTARIQEIAASGSQQCQSLDTVHSATCTITGPLDELIVNLACIAKAEDYVSELMQYVNDVLLPQMENALGIQFEVRNLQFAVAGKESFLNAPEHAAEAKLPKNWLEHPFTAPSLTPAAGVRSRTADSRIKTDEPQTDLSLV